MTFFWGGGGISEQKVFQSCKNQLNRWFLKRSNHKEKNSHQISLNK